MSTTECLESIPLSAPKSLRPATQPVAHPERRNRTQWSSLVWDASISEMLLMQHALECIYLFFLKGGRNIWVLSFGILKRTHNERPGSKLLGVGTVSYTWCSTYHNGTLISTGAYRCYHNKRRIAARGCFPSTSPLLAHVYCMTWTAAWFWTRAFSRRSIRILCCVF